MNDLGEQAGCAQSLNPGPENVAATGEIIQSNSANILDDEDKADVEVGADANADFDRSASNISSKLDRR